MVMSASSFSGFPADARILGLDIGSISVDMVLLDGLGTPLYSRYVRHHGQPDKVLCAELEALERTHAGIAAADASTKVALGDIAQPQVALALIGVIIIGLMLYFNVKGAILWGILITWGLGIIAQFTGWYAVNPEAGVYSLLPSGSFLPNFAALGDTAFKFDFSFMLNNTVEFAVIVFAFLFVDLFDTVGTLIGVAAKGNMLDKDGKLPRVGRALMADAIGTVAGACLGTSTVTSYVESSAGVAEGGRTQCRVWRWDRRPVTA